MSGGEITPEQCRAARRLLNWSMVRLGARSNLSETAIRNFEERLRVMPADSRAAIRAALEAAGVIFDEEVRLKDMKMR